MNVAFRIFYIINVRLNIYFLHNRQQYFIFVGSKPCSNIPPGPDFLIEIKTAIH